MLPDAPAKDERTPAQIVTAALSLFVSLRNLREPNPVRSHGFEPGSSGEGASYAASPCILWTTCRSALLEF